MPVLKIEVDKLKEFLENELDLLTLKDKARALKKEWDWNPFDKDDDQYTTAWQEFMHNIDLLSEMMEQVVITVEKASKVLGILEGGAKLEAAVQFLDKLIRLPFFLEWLDGPLFRFAISYVVRALNKKYGHDWQGANLFKI